VIAGQAEPVQRGKHRDHGGDRQSQHDVRPLDDVADDLLDRFAVVEIGEGIVGQRHAEELAERRPALGHLVDQQFFGRHRRLHLFYIGVVSCDGPVTVVHHAV